MPWKECSVMDERLRFVARLLEGEMMTEVCREFGISRKTGYKIFDRYKEHGLEALSDRSRRPVRYANQLPAQVESLIISLNPTLVSDLDALAVPAHAGQHPPSGVLLVGHYAVGAGLVGLAHVTSARGYRTCPALP